MLGRANRMLAARVTAIATSFEPTKHLEGPALGRARLTGNPVRDQVIDWAAQGYQPPASDGPFSLLVFGGSQGARFFSDMLPPALALLPAETRAGLFVVQQCREEDLARVEAAYEAAGVRAHLATFFANLPEEMAKAHLVIGRAGASTVAELTVMGRPAILVPLPHAIDNDQLQNATRLAESGGAWCIEQKELTPERLAERDRPPAGVARSAGAGGGRGQAPGPARCRRPARRSGRGAGRQTARKARKASIRPDGVDWTAREYDSMQMPGEMGPVHILGIGGIGMSAIAEILHAKGYTVQGSDQKDSANVRRLRAKGIRVFVGHDPVNLVGARFIVISTAVKPGNPELEAARQAGLPIIRRAEMLAELMRLYATVSVTGTHGKTTTTSLIAHIFNVARPRPHRHHRRHHQRMGLQRAPRQRQMDDRGGRRVRRHLHQDADPDRRRHQHRPGASRLLQDGREHAPRVRDVLSQHSLLRPRRHLHRPSRGRRDDRAPGAAARRAPPADLRRARQAPISS